MTSWIAAAIIVLAVHHDVSADEVADSIESGKRALEGGPNFPWYDAEEDSLRRVDVKSYDDGSKSRDSDWQGKPWSPPSSSSNWSISDWFWKTLKFLFWTLLALGVGLLVWLLIRVLLRMEGIETATQSGVASEENIRGDAERMESLPFQVKRPQSDLLAEARRNYELGDFAEAIIYLFSYQLLQLDKNQLIHLTRGKTNRQYLRELRMSVGLSKLLERTTICFEDVFFGHYKLEKRRFESCWNSLDDFHHQIEQCSP